MKQLLGTLTDPYFIGDSKTFRTFDLTGNTGVLKDGVVWSTITRVDFMLTDPNGKQITLPGSEETPGAGVGIWIAKTVPGSPLGTLNVSGWWYLDLTLFDGSNQEGYGTWRFFVNKPGKPTQ